MRQKVLVIGLDGATFDLITPMKEKLPNIRKIINEGVSDDLKSVIPPLSAPAWVSFMTGKNPGAHGVFDFMYRLDGTYSISFVTGIYQRKKSKNLWRVLSDYGKNVGVINVMVTYPPEEINGFMISGLTPPGKPFSYPVSLTDELEREVGRYLISPPGGFGIGKGNPDNFIKNLRRVEESRAKAASYLIKKYDWEFFMIVFDGIDAIQHEMWKYMDKNYPKYDDKTSDKYRNAIQEYYVYIDKIVGELLELVDGDTTIILMSDHGASPLHKQIYINTWLFENGYLKFKTTLSARLKLWMFKHSFTMKNIYSILLKFKSLLKLGMMIQKRSVRGRRGQGMLSLLFLSQSDVDWSQTKAYSQGSLGQIFLNLKGREPEGIVESGKEYEEVREEIIKKLYEFEDPENGNVVVEKVFKKEEIYSGRYLERAPDILVLTMPTYSPIERFQFVSNALIETSRASGKHEMNGIIIMRGKDIKKGVKIENSQIVDLFPTILRIMDLPIPDDIDGVILKDAFEKI
jgi:predicted AlkP superfamily phosphohydrolase/phosphomutase